MNPADYKSERERRGTQESVAALLMSSTENKPEREQRGKSSKLRRWRKARGLTNEAAAEFIGVPLRTFEDWQSGRRSPAALSAAALAEKIKLRKSKKP
jgi:DNA-binding transcriptional regulator YiaG